MSEQTDEFLAHHGVVGMKWGKRKGGSSSGGSSSGGSSKGGAPKGAAKAIRKEMYKSAGASIKANKGKTVAAALLVGGSQTAGFTLARAAGHSKGKSLAIGLIGGAPGGMLALHLSAKKAAKNA